MLFRSLKPAATEKGKVQPAVPLEPLRSAACSLWGPASLAVAKARSSTMRALAIMLPIQGHSKKGHLLQWGSPSHSFMAQPELQKVSGVQRKCWLATLPNELEFCFGAWWLLLLALLSVTMEMYYVYMCVFSRRCRLENEGTKFWRTKVNHFNN